MHSIFRVNGVVVTQYILSFSDKYFHWNKVLQVIDTCNFRKVPSTLKSEYPSLMNPFSVNSHFDPIKQDVTRELKIIQ